MPPCAMRDQAFNLAQSVHNCEGRCTIAGPKPRQPLTSGNADRDAYAEMMMPLKFIYLRLLPPVTQGIRPLVSTSTRDVLAWLFRLKINLLFDLQFDGKEATRFHAPCLIKPATEQTPWASV